MANIIVCCFSTGTQLEESVKQAFSLLGFEEIDKKRGNECEDWIIDLKFSQEVEFGVMEVKGRKTKTKHVRYWAMS